MKKQVILYTKSLKLKWSWTFIQVAIGALVGNHFNLGLVNWLILVAVFFLFQLFYGVIYILNDLLDHKDDKKDPTKAKRPIASGAISKKSALLFAITLVTVVSVLSFLISSIFFFFELLFLLYNLIYTIILKKVVYLDAFANGVTHSARVLMGMIVFGSYISMSVILASYFLATTIAIIKRFKEIRSSEVGRKSLEKYSLGISKVLISILTISLILVIVSAKTWEEKTTVLVGLILELSLVGGFFLSIRFREKISALYNS